MDVLGHNVTPIKVKVDAPASTAFRLCVAASKGNLFKDSGALHEPAVLFARRVAPGRWTEQQLITSSDLQSYMSVPGSVPQLMQTPAREIRLAERILAMREQIFD